MKGSAFLAEWFAKVKADFILNFVTGDRWSLILNGLIVTLKITVVAIFIGIAIGIILATIRSTYDMTRNENRSGFKQSLLSFLNSLAKIYLTVIRGTPVVLQLLIIYFVIFASSDNGVLIAALAFGINSGAYVAEIIRGGIMSIDRGQMEAGRSLGFNYFETMRYIIIPQAFKNVLPSLANEFIALLKETSVAGYVAVQDLTRAGNIIRSKTYSAFMPLVAVALIYLAMVMVLTYFVGILERRLRNSER
ncbi:Arginine transport system permease protein ArtQ [bioreactor metagenome]|uniref:Arginine transport system permease protein ArtQ n=1 Tax=bioreactor metagenome TaxID=1076179 RepID=A0A644ZVK6_9ZZZZ|nr:amino acid ABC transporter permease [Candidatus Metalachnospira sp.]